MTWIKLDDSFADHPKVAGLSDRAFRVHITGLLYCGKYLTDGVIPRSVANKFCINNASNLIKKLVESGLWKPVEGGFEINDYLKYQTSKAQAEMEKETNRLRAQKARKARAEALRNGVNAPERSSTEAHTPTPTDSTTDNKKPLVRPTVEQEEVLEFCNLLADRILENLKSKSKFPDRAKRPTVSPGWIKQMDLLIRKDGRAAVEVRQVIEWCQSDEFWSSNILSPSSLRAKFDQLLLKMATSRNFVIPQTLIPHSEINAPGQYGVKICGNCKQEWPCSKSQENLF